MVLREKDSRMKIQILPSVTWIRDAVEQSEGYGREQVFQGAVMNWDTLEIS